MGKGVEASGRPIAVITQSFPHFDFPASSHRESPNEPPTSRIPFLMTMTIAAYPLVFPTRLSIDPSCGEV